MAPVLLIVNRSRSEFPRTVISPISSPTKTLTVVPLSTSKLKSTFILAPDFFLTSVVTVPVASRVKNLNILNSSTFEIEFELKVNTELLSAFILLISGVEILKPETGPST